MSQNLCLICCYSFQDKPNRFISDEARESFDKFSKQLGCPLNASNNKTANKTKSTLNLPFGNHVTVCGDCLSLVVVYVQRQAVQKEKEEHVLKLQQEVCKAVNELSTVVEDVQWHINHLHSTITNGDASMLDKFISKSGPQTFSARKQKELQAKSFREKVLSLNAGRGHFKFKDIRRPRRDEPIHIKTEALELAPVNTYAEADDLWNDDFVDLPYDDLGSPESPHPSISEPVSTTSGTNKKIVVERSLGKLESHQTWNKVEDEGHQDFSDSDLYNTNEGQESSEEDQSEGSDWSGEKTRTLKRKRGAGRPSTGSSKRISVKYGELLTPERAARWKDNLFGRLMEQFNNQIFGEEETPLSCDDKNKQQSDESKGNTDAGEEGAAEASAVVPIPKPKYFQIVDDQIQLGKVPVRVAEEKRMLECSRCFKQFYEERDCTSGTVQLETLMRTHILDKHYADKKGRPPPEEIQVVSFIGSQTKSRLSYKIADSMLYGYERRRYKGDHLPSYWRCDYRQRNCAASILLKNGKYTRLKKGWNPDGTHTIHSPDVEKTKIQMALGQAKEMYLTSNLHIDEVVTIIRSQTGMDEKVLPLEKLKRAMRYSKYKSRGMAPEEKLNQEQQCCYCGKICKVGGALMRHLRSVHKEYME